MFNRRSFLATIGATLVCRPLAAREAIVSKQMKQLGRPLRILVPDGSQANVQPVMARFTAELGCPCEMIITDLDSINPTLTLESLAPRLEVDIALPATFGIPDLSENAAILPLEGFARSSTGAEAAGQGGWYDGRLWGYQTDGDVYLMFYHADMLENLEEMKRYADTFGRALAVPMTWGELDQQMAFFHRPEEGQFGGCLFRSSSYSVWEWWARLHANGGHPFGNGANATLHSEAGVAALVAMKASKAHLTGANLGLFDNWSRYNRGDIYANIGWGGTQKSLHKSGAGMKGRVRHGPLPGKSGTPLAYFNWGWSYVVARNTPVPELAHAFCEFSVSPGPSADAVAAVDGYFDPFRSEHYDDPRIIEAYGTSFLEEHRKAMGAAIPDLYLSRRNEYFEILATWLQMALHDRAEPEAALMNVSERWDIITEQVGRAQQAERWTKLLQSYPPSYR